MLQLHALQLVSDRILFGLARLRQSSRPSDGALNRLTGGMFAASVYARNGFGQNEQSRPGLAAGAHDVPGSPERASAEVVVFGPNAASLPNSPSDWFEPRMASTIPAASDPLRPRGLIEGAHTLDPENLDEALPRPQPGDTKPTSSRWRR